MDFLGKERTLIYGILPKFDPLMVERGRERCGQCESEGFNERERCGERGGREGGRDVVRLRGRD